MIDIHVVDKACGRRTLFIIDDRCDADTVVISLAFDNL